jgi:hypothetical protein
MSTSNDTSLKIKNNWLKRVATLVEIRLFGRWCERSSHVIFLNRHVCVKITRSGLLSEAATLQFIQSISPYQYRKYIAHLPTRDVATS